MLAKLAFTCIIFVLPTSIFAQTAAPVASSPVKPSAPKTTPPKPEMATWSEPAEKGFGISKADFSSMGLSKLTSDEFVALLYWASEQERKAKEEASATTLSQTLTFSCGRTIAQAAEYDKVNIYLNISEKTPPELSSRIRQNFRAIKDVQVVFSSKGADLNVVIIVLELRINLINNRVIKQGTQQA